MARVEALERELAQLREDSPSRAYMGNPRAGALARARAQYADALAELEPLREENADLREQIAALQQSVAPMREQLSDIERHNDDVGELRAALDQTRAELQRTEQALATARRQWRDERTHYDRGGLRIDLAAVGADTPCCDAVLAPPTAHRASLDADAPFDYATAGRDATWILRAGYDAPPGSALFRELWLRTSAGDQLVWNGGDRGLRQPLDHDPRTRDGNHLALVAEDERDAQWLIRLRRDGETWVAATPLPLADTHTILGPAHPREPRVLAWSGHRILSIDLDSGATAAEWRGGPSTEVVAAHYDRRGDVVLAAFRQRGTRSLRHCWYELMHATGRWNLGGLGQRLLTGGFPPNIDAQAALARPAVQMTAISTTDMP